MNILNKVFFPIKSNDKNKIFYYIPYFLLLLWILLSVVSIGFISFININNGFVLFSIIIRIIIALTGLYFFNRIFLNRENDKTTYNIFKAFVGYGVVFTYVFYSLPRLVGEFLGNISKSSSIYHYIFILIIAFFPAVLYLFLRLDGTRLILGFFTQKEIDDEKKIKKNKELNKKEIKKIKSERSFLANLWYEWIDVIIQAIIIALLIQQFIFQMYQIPSESMVPTFLVRDRVVVNKMVYGPHIPVTDWKFPSPFKPDTGDIVVFENPEMDDPNSDIRYKNVFIRIFHPFVYMLTLSLVDIDKYPMDHPDERKRGTPKEKFIVKRCIAKPGEKICMVNDKVYKKTKTSDWKLMSDIKGEKEYGYVDLYKQDYPKLQYQIMHPELREELNKIERFIEKDTNESLEEQLINEKRIFINSLKNSNYKILKNNLEKISNDLVQDKFKEYFNDYRELYNIYYYSVKKFEEYIEYSDGDLNYFDNEINTKLNINKNSSPFKIYMKRVNALNKIYQLKCMNKNMELIKNINFINSNQFMNNNIFNEIFINDLKNYLIVINYIDNYFFHFRNFPEFPEGEGNYFKKGEFFLMGDNRYNSHDCRFNKTNNNQTAVEMINLDDDDNTDFSMKISYEWAPSTIKIKYILGKAEAIYWPIDRMKKF